MVDLENGGSPPRLWPPAGVHAFAWGGVAVIVLVLLLVAQGVPSGEAWSGWTESRELRHPAYAERVYPGEVFRTRANTWSNLAYVLVGLYAIGFGWHDFRAPRTVAAGYLVRTPPMSLLFGVACLYLGFGSGFFHASLTRRGQQLDVAAMYAPLLALIAINAGRWLPRVKTTARGSGLPSWPLLAGLVLAVSFLLYRYKWSMRSGVVLPALILTVGGFALVDLFLPRRPAFRWLGLSAVALVAARLCWLLDVAGRFSGPDAWLQGHAVWHLLTGLSLVGAYLFCRSERVATGHAG